MGKDRPQEDPVIAEFQDRRREFHPPWNRNFFFLLAPGFALAALGHGYFEQAWMTLVGAPLFAVGMEAVQGREGMQLPSLTCHSCGARL